MSRGYALFDLDHTILPFDTQALFCNFVLQREGWRRIYLLWFIPCLPLVALKILNLRTMKRVFASYLVGMQRETLMNHVSDFLESDFEKALYPAVVAEIERNRSEGRLLILNSASPEFYLEGISDKLGFDHFIEDPEILQLEGLLDDPEEETTEEEKPESSKDKPAAAPEQKKAA